MRAIVRARQSRPCAAAVSGVTSWSLKPPISDSTDCGVKRSLPSPASPIACLHAFAWSSASSTVKSAGTPACSA